MTEKMGGSYFSQAEAEQPLGFYAVNIYGDGSIASQVEPPSIHQLFQAQQSQEKQRDSDVKAREEVREWEYRIKLALQIGRGAVLASIVGSMVAGCVPGREGSLPVTMASDNATGYVSDVSLISSIPTLDIMPSISPSPRIFPSNTLSIMSSPTEITPSQTSTITSTLTMMETSTITLTSTKTEKPTKTQIPTKTETPTVPPPPPTPDGLQCSESNKLNGYVNLSKGLLAKNKVPMYSILQAIPNFGDDPNTKWVAESPFCTGIFMSEGEMKNIYTGEWRVSDTKKCVKEALQELVDKWGTDFSYVSNNTSLYLLSNLNDTDKCGYLTIPVDKEFRNSYIRLFGRIPYNKTERISTPVPPPPTIGK